MKNVKKLLCLMLALAMVFSLAVPAFAAEEVFEEEEGYACPQCQYALKNGDFLLKTTTRIVTAGTCRFYSKQHNHTIPVYQNRDYCSKCGYYNALYTRNGIDECPYA
ncbi:MAG: hypothetical protein HFE94_08505 [Acutalibacter sp.]|nr:hypothetical protein [Acutalibacter sp.]